MALLEHRADGTRVYGPYMSTTIGRQIVVLKLADGRKTSRSFARWLMEQQVGRPLRDDEHVDHVDENRVNDAIGNLQILTPGDNVRKSHAVIKWYEFTCPTCGVRARKEARIVRSNWKKGRAGPYCGRTCAHR